MDSMAAFMAHLLFDYCTHNPAGDYTCYFTHDIVASASPTTYPNPKNYPPGEAVFTVAPASVPGWYLTQGNPLRLKAEGDPERLVVGGGYRPGCACRSLTGTDRHIRATG